MHNLGVAKQTQINLTNKKADEQKIVESRLALYVAKHTSVNVVDHLTKTIKTCFKGANDVTLSRTKCTGIIANVWHPFFVNELKTDIDGVYSLIVDESTDVGAVKFLGVTIKYFSKKHSSIICTFLKLQEIDRGTADNIVLFRRSVRSFCRRSWNS